MDTSRLVGWLTAGCLDKRREHRLESLHRHLRDSDMTVKNSMKYCSLGGSKSCSHLTYP